MSKRHISKLLTFPYNFQSLKGTDAIKNVGLIPTSVYKKRGQFYLGNGIHGQFSQIYSEVLQAIVEKDEEYLKQIMEPNLFQRIMSGLQDLDKQGLTLRYSQEENSKPGDEIIQDLESNKNESQFQKIFYQNFIYEESDLQMTLESMGIFGPRIIRSENQNSKFLPLRSFISSRDFSAVYNNQILALNIHFNSSRKLYVTDEEQNLVVGDNSNQLEKHMWRFETYTPNLDWVITDMDNYLNTNKYQ